MEGIREGDYHHWHGVMEGIYRFHDLMLARLMDLAGEDTAVVLMSDHGFQSARGTPSGTLSNR